MKCSLDISNFLEELSSLPILLFSSISLHWSLTKAFLSLLAILWNSAFKWVYLSFSPLLFTFLFTAIYNASSDIHFAVLHFFSLGMFLLPVSCTMSRTSIHSSSGTQLANLIIWTTALSNSVKLSHTVWGHPRWTDHGGEVWQNLVHWRREWQTTSVFLTWEPHEQYEMAKR